MKRTALNVAAVSLILFAGLLLVPFQLSYADSFTVNVPNAQGGYTAIAIQSSGNGYVGPKGEYYSSFPSVLQLQAAYGAGAPNSAVAAPVQAVAKMASAQVKPKLVVPIAGIVVFLLCLIAVGSVLYFMPNIVAGFREYFNFKPTKLQRISTGSFGLIVLLFLLPWNTVSCGHEKVASFTGMDLTLGKAMPSGGMSEDTPKIQDWRAVAALMICVVGMLTGFLLKERVVNIVQAVGGWAGGILLCLLKGKWDHDIMAQGGGAVTIDYQFGFWAAILIFLIIGTVNILSFLGLLNKVNPDLAKALSLKGRVKPDFCSQCGAKVLSGSSFCAECGHSLK